MWLQQRLKGLPGLLSSSWARRLLALLCALLAACWYLGGALPRPRLPWPRGPDGAALAGRCLQAEARAWQALAARGEARLLQAPEGGGAAPALVGNGHLLLDVAGDRLWVSAAGRGPAAGPEHLLDYTPLAQLRAPAGASWHEAGASLAVPREGAVRRVRCVRAGPPAAEGECVTVREELLAHRGRPHLYLQRLAVANPTDRLVAFEVSGPATAALGSPPVGPGGGKFATSLEKAGERQFFLSAGRVVQPGSATAVAVVVAAAKKLVNRVQVAPKSQFEETLLSVVHSSEPVELSRLDEALGRLREAARKEILEVMKMRTEDLVQEHRQAWADLFISGKARALLAWPGTVSTPEQANSLVAR